MPRWDQKQAKQASQELLSSMFKALVMIPAPTPLCTRSSVHHGRGGVTSICQIATLQALACLRRTLWENEVVRESLCPDADAYLRVNRCTRTWTCVCWGPDGCMTFLTLCLLCVCVCVCDSLSLGLGARLASQPAQGSSCPMLGLQMCTTRPWFYLLQSHCIY